MQNKNIVFLYPSEPFNLRKIDDGYQEEYSMAKAAGLKVYLIDIENMSQSVIFPAIDPYAYIVYRGWMLSETAYTQLEQRFGDRLLTSKKDYYNAHYFPNWFHDICAFTIPSIITDEKHAQDAFKNFAGKAFIKDYVKSLKTGKGSIVDSAEDVQRAINDMKSYRGTIEGGIVLREVAQFKPDSEIRFFVIKDKIFSPLQDCAKYNLVEEVIKKLATKHLQFYSVDVATTIDDKNIVIEVGDGQVSDYVGWNLEDFVHVLAELGSNG